VAARDRALEQEAPVRSEKIHQKRCGKTNYRDQQHAERVAFRRRVADKNNIMRAYKCDRCAFWHLTHMPAETFSWLRATGSR